MVHDETNRMIAGLLARMQHPEFPVPIGVFYCDPAKPYDVGGSGAGRGNHAEKSPPGDLNALLRKGKNLDSGTVLISTMRNKEPGFLQPGFLYGRHVWIASGSHDKIPHAPLYPGAVSSIIGGVRV